MKVCRDRFGNEIHLTDERWTYIRVQHPEISPYLEEIIETLRAPEVVKKSKRDGKVHLYFKFFDHILGGKFILVVVKMEARKFIITAYVTDYVKKGETIWEKSS